MRQEVYNISLYLLLVSSAFSTMADNIYFNDKSQETDKKENTTKRDNKAESRSVDIKQKLFMAGSLINSFLIVLVNGLGLRIMVKSGHTRLKHIYLLNLTVADLLVGIISPVLAVLSEVFYWPREFYSCLLSKVVKSTLGKVSVFSCCSISFDRLLSVEYPASNTLFHSKKFRLTVVLAMWVVSCLWSFGVPLLWHPPVKNFKKCTHRAVILPTVSVYSSTYAFFFPVMFVMLLVHVQIWRVFRQSAQLSHSVVAPIHSDVDQPTIVVTTETGSNVVSQISLMSTKKARMKKQEMRLVKSLTLVWVLIFVTWIPIRTMNMIELHNPELIAWFGVDNFSTMLYPAILLSHFSSFVNNIVYCLGSPDLRGKCLYYYLLVATCGQAKKGYCIPKGWSIRVGKNGRKLNSLVQRSTFVGEGRTTMTASPSRKSYWEAKHSHARELPRVFFQDFASETPVSGDKKPRSTVQKSAIGPTRNVHSKLDASDSPWAVVKPCSSDEMALMNTSSSFDWSLPANVPLHEDPEETPTRSTSFSA